MDLLRLTRNVEENDLRCKQNKTEAVEQQEVGIAVGLTAESKNTCFLKRSSRYVIEQHDVPATIQTQRSMSSQSSSQS